MYNLLIALGIGAAAFGVGYGVTRTLIAGILPAMLGAGLAYVLLARRTGRRLQAVVDHVGQLLRKERPAEAMRVLEGARSLGRWQFLVSSQLHSQMGGLAYMQRDFDTAREHLSQAWSRDWAAQGMLATIDFREKRIDQAVERLEKASGAGRKQPVFWALYTYVLVKSGRREQALDVLARGRKILEDNEALKTLQNAVSNRRRLKMKAFGQQWYTFFPEHYSARRLGQQRTGGGRGYPMPRR